MAHPSDRTLVIIPTFNECENIPLILNRLRTAAPEVDVLIVDDNSPDGTGDVADELAASDEQVFTLRRGAKEGLARAYVAGFRWGLERDYTVLCEMDADGSHAPEQLRILLGQVDLGGDLVIGSRYVEGGKVVNWPAHRFLLSKLGNYYTALALGGGVHDMTAGYRAYRRSVLEEINLDEISDAGYIFQVDLVRRAIDLGFDVREVPITFAEREIGESKLSGNFITDSLAVVTLWGARHRSEQIKNFATAFGGLAKHQITSMIERKRQGLSLR